MSEEVTTRFQDLSSGGGDSTVDPSRREVEVRRRRPAPPLPAAPGCTPGGTASNGSGSAMAGFAIWFVLLPLAYGAFARRMTTRRRS